MQPWPCLEFFLAHVFLACTVVAYQLAVGLGRLGICTLWTVIAGAGTSCRYGRAATWAEFSGAAFALPWLTPCSWFPFVLHRGRIRGSTRPARFSRGLAVCSAFACSPPSRGSGRAGFASPSVQWAAMCAATAVSLAILARTRLVALAPQRQDGPFLRGKAAG